MVVDKTGQLHANCTSIQRVSEITKGRHITCSKSTINQSLFYNFARKKHIIWQDSKLQRNI